MAIDPYDPCPCGSGKKFKWCCQPIHVPIDKAFRLEADGQHEMALKTIDEVVAAHPANPEAWGRKAQLLYQNGRADEAEEALQKAFDINPNYPFGHLLKGSFRQAEGEIPGALLLFRKAAELYDPEARDVLAQLYGIIADCEFKLNRPVAAKAALKMALRAQPGSVELRDGIEEAFGEESPYPRAARKDYTFQSPPASAGGARRAAWDKAMAGSARLSEAARAFEQLTNEDAQDAAAWYNLALARAWLGDNAAALEALERYVQLEANEAGAADAWALAEVLKMGWRLEDQCDYAEHSYVLQIRDPQRLVQVLQDWQQQFRIIIFPPRSQEEQQSGIIMGMVLDRQSSLVVGSGGPEYARLGAHMLIIGGQMRLSNIDAEALERARDAFRRDADLALMQVRKEVRPASFSDVLSGALVFPVRAASEAEAARGVREQVQQYFANTWPQLPRKSLGGAKPVDAVGDPQLRKKLAGIVQFLEDCANIGGRKSGYDFGELRQHLGIGRSGSGGGDVAAMETAELATLQTDGLSDEQLEQAFQAAQRQDARDLAERFARALVARPPRPDRPDRYPWFAHLITQALGAGATDAALDHVNEGEKFDCEHNEGRRRNDYELRRAQVHAKRGEAEQAADVFERLIQRAPGELRYRAQAAEALLGARQGARALQFAEGGLAQAREKQDRDSEQHFQELVAAAKKQVGG